MLGLTRQDRVVGYALRFGGASLVDMGNVLGFLRTDSFSIAAWVHFSGLSGGVIAGKAGAGAHQDGRGYLLAEQADGSVFAALRNNQQSGNYARTWSATGIVTTARWYHIALTYAGTSNPSGMVTYVNGTPLTPATTTNALSATIVTTLAFRWGSLTGPSGGSGFLSGCSLGLVVYGKALSGSEVTSIYAGRTIADLTSVGPTSDLVGYWPVTPSDSPTGTISDHSGSGYHGTPSGFAAGDIVPVRFSELRA